MGTPFPRVPTLLHPRAQDKVHLSILRCGRAQPLSMHCWTHVTRTTKLNVCDQGGTCALPKLSTNRSSCRMQKTQLLQSKIPLTNVHDDPGQSSQLAVPLDPCLFCMDFCRAVILQGLIAASCLKCECFIVRFRCRDFERLVTALHWFEISWRRVWCASERFLGNDATKRVHGSESAVITLLTFSVWSQCGWIQTKELIFNVWRNSREYNLAFSGRGAVSLHHLM